MRNLMYVLLFCFLSIFIVSCSSNNAVNTKHKKPTTNVTNDDSDKDEMTIEISELPVSVAEYVSKNHPENVIVKAEENSKGYGVKLDNKIELVFDQQGFFTKIEKDVEEDNDDEKNN